ncbi:Piwi domain-containing protein [Spirulina sp. CCNP1310]|uniref:Piwi domain-containing protein n=1 Tax=Spirulina sp. CCNP1310 TaxID=3110249 RepID=UPI002B22150F|nr:Piwi domain-containing protein [Spirulina sp. CCNP1310]MEA5419103.1 Piwi domain-containing protein [Spirulina sp. CCNP1310]
MTVQNQADYANAVINFKLKSPLKNTIAQEVKVIDNIKIERDYTTRGWVIQNTPALSIAIKSRIILQAGFGEVIKQLKDIEDLIDVWVLVRNLNFKAKIIDIVGPMDDHRDRLLSLATTETIRQHLQQADPQEWVVRLQGNYDYPLGCLQPSLDLVTLEKLGLHLPQVTSYLRLQPEKRREMVEKLAKIIRKQPDWVSMERQPHFFTTAAHIGCSQQIRFGNHYIAEHQKQTLIQNLRRHGVYLKAPQFIENSTLKIGLIDARKNMINTGFSKDLKSCLQAIGFTTHISSTQRITEISLSTLEQAVDHIQQQSVDLILALLPQKTATSEPIYHRLKRLTINQGIPSQMIYEQTLANPYAVNNVVMGILAKTGNTLFTLAQPLDFTDFVVGLDVARDRKRNSPGSINTTAITRIYTNGGQLLNYRLHDSALEGETLPRHVLEMLFPRSQFVSKRVVIHRDGPFRGEEKQILREIAIQLNAQFYCVEIRKTGFPRLYRLNSQGKVQQPQKGDILKLSDTEALLVSSLPPFANATAQPLSVISDPSLGIERAIQSVLALTLLHLGSVPQPRLPVSIYYSDKIGYLALKGIKPPDLDGHLPFWL